MVGAGARPARRAGMQATPPAGLASQRIASGKNSPPMLAASHLRRDWEPQLPGHAMPTTTGGGCGPPQPAGPRSPTPTVTVAPGCTDDDADAWLNGVDDFSADADGCGDPCPMTDGAPPPRNGDTDSDSAGTGTEVLYQRERVAVWPSASMCILGRVSIVKQCGVVFLAWLPSASSGGGGMRAHARSARARCADQGSAASLAMAARARYALHPLPVGEVQALRVRRPYLVAPSLVVVMRDGLSLPPLHFHAGASASS
eukprot:248530-Chlamydomonas_euryale.AAC.1